MKKFRANISYDLKITYIKVSANSSWPIVAATQPPGTDFKQKEITLSLVLILIFPTFQPFPPLLSFAFTATDFFPSVIALFFAPKEMNFNCRIREELDLRVNPSCKENRKRFRRSVYPLNYFILYTDIYNFVKYRRISTKK